MTDRGLSIVSAVLINGLVLASMAFAQMGDASQARQPLAHLDAVPVAPVEMPKRGIETPERVLPRISAPAVPAPPESKTVSLSTEVDRTRAKRKTRPAQKTRVTKTRRDAPDIHKARKTAADRRRAMAKAIDALKPDPRADLAARTGLKGGHARGASTDPATLDNRANEVNRIIFAIQTQFEVSTMIAPAQRKRLRAKVAFAFDDAGKLTAPPRIVQSSGSRLFDQAAHRALMQFSASGPARLPVPSATRKRSFVLWMSGKN